MFPPNDEISNFNNIARRLWIILFYMCKDFYLYKCLFTKFGFIFDDFQCKFLFSFVIKYFENLPIRPFPNHRKDFKSISNMIILNENVLFSTLKRYLLLVIENIFSALYSLSFLSLMAEIVDFLVLFYLRKLMTCEIVTVELNCSLPI